MGIAPVDYCSRSFFLEPEEKNAVNLRLNALFTAIAEAAADCPVPVAVLLSGSLVYREPSLSFRNGQLLGLRSDADLIAVTPRRADVPNLFAIEDQTRGAATDVVRSFHYVPLDAAGNARASQTLLSVWHGKDTPIAASFPLPQVPRPRVDPVLICQLLVGRLLTVVGHIHTHIHLRTAGFYEIDAATHAYDMRKLLLTMLEVQYFERVDGCFGIAPAMDLVKEGLFRPIFDDETVRAVVRARERFDPDEALPDIDIDRAMLAALRGFLDLPPDTEATALVEAVSARYCSSGAAAALAMPAVLAVLLARLVPDARRRAAAQAALRRLQAAGGIAEIDEAVAQLLDASATAEGLADERFSQNTARLWLYHLRIFNDPAGTPPAA